MMRWILLPLILFASLAPVSAAGLTQRAWMEQLTDSLGWGYGLPDDPRDADYIALLSGQRDLLLEAEENHRRADRVAIKRQTNLGSYSGSGWVSGRREPVQLHLDFLLPHNGRYDLSTVTRLPGVKIQIAEQEFIASAGEQLTYQNLGTVDLVAGPTEAVVSLPADAGIDYLRLSAAPRPGIAPLNGWQPEQPLTQSDLAITTLQALDLLSTLPRTGRVDTFEAESGKSQPGVKKVTDRHLGVPSGGRWVRAGSQETEWHFPVGVPRAGCYQLSLQGLGQAPVTVAAAGILKRKLTFGPALSKVSLGTFCLPGGAVVLSFELPPWAGVDSLELTELDTRSAVLNGLLGLTVEKKTIENQTLNELLQLLSSLTH